MSGTLYIVATPIGNLDDLSPRARQTLASANLIAAEDTRHTGRLLSHIGAKTPQKALHDHNESEVVPALIKALESGNDVALVSDAGTPLVSDPGFRLVQAAHEHGIPVSPLPGPSAVVTALSASGLPSDRFTFEGFLPPKARARAEALAALAYESRTMIFFESVHRIVGTLSAMIEVFGEDRAAFVGRELSKLHEQCVRASLLEISGLLAVGEVPLKGEFVIVVAGNIGDVKPALDVTTLLTELSKSLSTKEAAAVAARVTGESRNALYQRLLELRGG